MLLGFLKVKLVYFLRMAAILIKKVWLALPTYSTCLKSVANQIQDDPTTDETSNRTLVN